MNGNAAYEIKLAIKWYVSVVIFLKHQHIQFNENCEVEQAISIKF